MWPDYCKKETLAEHRGPKAVTNDDRLLRPTIDILRDLAKALARQAAAEDDARSLSGSGAAPVPDATGAQARMVGE